MPHVKQSMTKTQARANVKRSREGLRWVDEALTKGDAADLGEALIEAIGALVLIQDALEGDYSGSEYAGIRGVK